MIYEQAMKQIQNIIEKEKNPLKKVVDYLQTTFGAYTWVGIYLVKNNNLYLGPWKGPHATEHTKIPIGYGICGAAAETGKIENIADVRDDPRYLSCFISTRSEIVVPITFKEIIIGEIDIDSDKINAFGHDDEIFLKKIADMLAEHIHNS